MLAIKRDPIPTPWSQMNEIMGGGLAGGELGIVMGSTGCGKSHALVDIGCAAVLHGFNVAHYTFELGDVYVGKRYDSRVSEVPFDNLCEHKEAVKKSLERIKGQLVIKAFPAKSITALGIKNHVNQLTLRDKRPQLIIVDYVDILKSSKHYDQKRLEEESACEELRALAQELGLPIWTASQSNRDGLDQEVLTLKHVAECFGKAMISDFFLTMCRKKDNSNSTLGNFYIAKSRLGIDGMKFNILVDTSLSKFEILDEKDIPEGSDIQELDAHELLKKRFRDLQKEGKI
jgi:replicative DNA helicase